MKTKIEIKVSNEENDINYNIIFNDGQQFETLKQFDVNSFDDLIKILIDKLNYNLLSQELNEKLEINENCVSIAKKEFKFNSFVQTIKFKNLSKYLEKILDEINKYLHDDNLIIAHTVIAKYNGKTYVIDNTYHTINEIENHLNLGNKVILYAPKMDDDTITYASILL